MIQELIHPKICKNFSRLESWYESKIQQVDGGPFYSSFDIRDSGFKVSPVDANIFPAGFNNICQVDKDHAPERIQAFFHSHLLKKQPQRIALVTEEHTNNLYYWDNVATLCELIRECEIEVRVFLPSFLDTPLQLTSASGKMVEVFGAGSKDGSCDFGDFEADLVISNNDFSKAYDQWIETCKVAINPSYELGWHVRKKSQFFEGYNRLANEFAQIIGEDPRIFSIKTEAVEFDISSELSRKFLADRVDEVIAQLRESYCQLGWAQAPYVFVKNNSGTYGLGVTQVASGQEILSWSYKDRKKMKAVKGGGRMSEVIIQEGIPTALLSGEASAEPALYMIGHQLAGGFLRTHGAKNNLESLNSPGAVFQRLCVSDLSINIEGCPMENCYGWIAKVGHLAILEEFQLVKQLRAE